jgi:hypothetical protein
MLGLISQTTANFADYRRQWEEILLPAPSYLDAQPSRLVEVTGFEPVPGNLRMLRHVPDGLGARGTPGRGPARLHPGRRRLRPRHRLVGPRRPPRVRPAAARAAAGQQPQRQITLATIGPEGGWARIEATYSLSAAAAKLRHDPAQLRHWLGEQRRQIDRAEVDRHTRDKRLSRFHRINPASPIRSAGKQR